MLARLDQRLPASPSLLGGNASLADFGRTWNRLLDSGAQVRGLITDRSLLGCVTHHSMTEPMLARDPQRVPVALLRRFFFVDPSSLDTAPLKPFADLRTFASMTDEAVALFDRANPFTREQVLAGDLGCRNADDVVQLLDMCFTSFERTVTMVARINYTVFFSHVAPLVHRARTMAYWEGVPFPQAAMRDASMSMRDYGQQLIDAHLVLWSVVVWRLSVSVFIENALDLHPMDDGVPTPLHQLHNKIAYELVRFRGTHVDLLTHTTKSACYSDEAFVLRALSSQVYPHCLNVMCIEELPDISDVLPLANLWYDTGVRKARDSAMQAVAHVFACKQLNQKCSMRDLCKLILDYADAFPGFNRLFKIELHCALLGHLPHAQGRPNMAAILRINASFLFEEGGPSTPLRQTLIHTWMDHSLYTLMFLLREMLLYAIERDMVLDKIMNNNYRWHQHKRIVRLCNGDVRRVLSYQAAKRPNHPFDWSQMQRDVLNRNSNKKKVGIVINYHVAGLKAISKLRKATFEVIILNKMTSCNTFYGDSIHFDEVASVAALERVSDALCLTAWAASHAADASSVLQTRWLQLFMTPNGFERVRRMQFDYYIYDVSDHSFVGEIYALYEHCPMDYLYLRTYLLLVIHFGTRRPFFLPSNYAARQILALRTRHDIEPWADTPELLGKCLMCDRCGYWATPLIEPPFTGEKKSAITTAAVAAAATEAAVAAATAAADFSEDGDEDEDDPMDIEDGESVRERERVDAMVEAMDAEEGAKRRLKRAHRKVIQSTYESLSWFDPVSNRLYCRRKHRAEDNPLDELYAAIPDIAEDDDDEEMDGDNVHTVDRASHKSKRKKPTHDADVMTNATTLASMAMGADAYEEDNEVLMLLQDVNKLKSAKNMALLESYAAHHLAPTPASASTGAYVPVTEVDLTKGPAPDVSSRHIRKMDPADMFLMRYFERANGGQLKRIDMAGVWLSTKHGVEGLCDSCGVLHKVENRNITNQGVSCLHHLTSNMRDDDPMRSILEERERRQQRNRRHGTKQQSSHLQSNKYATQAAPPIPSSQLPEIQPRWLRVTSRVPGKRIEPIRDGNGVVIPCFYCRDADAEHTVLIYDRSVRLCRIPLCTYDHNRATRHLPRYTIPSGSQIMDALAMHTIV
jgi:hypothetical protein